jgi:hypothetical protein
MELSIFEEERGKKKEKKTYYHRHIIRDHENILSEITKKNTVVYYESIKRELKIKPIYECRCDERLQTKTKRFTRLSYTWLVVELEHLKIKTRLTKEKFPSVKGECEI